MIARIRLMTRSPEGWKPGLRRRRGDGFRRRLLVARQTHEDVLERHGFAGELPQNPALGNREAKDLFGQLSVVGAVNADAGFSISRRLFGGGNSRNPCEVV